MSDAAAIASRLRILIASPMLYYPGCGNGGGELCFELLRHLSAEYEVHFVGFETPETDTGHARKALQILAASVTTVPLPKDWWSGGLRSALRQFVSGVPREVSATASAAMSATLSNVAKQCRPNVVLLQFPHMAQYVGAAPHVPVIIDVQDACMVSRFRQWQTFEGNWTRRLMRLHSWWTWANFEIKTYARAQRLMALSAGDLGILRTFVPTVPAFVSPAAWNVVDKPPLAAGSNILFMGNFAHAPNADGLQWLLAEVWPRVRALLPQAQLQIAGRHVPPDLELGPLDGVQVLGFVDDVRPLLESAAISLVPYRFGGGIKIKTLESMARGCPVLATTVGAEGLGARDGVHLRVADGAAAFVQAIVEMLGSPEHRYGLAVEALRLVRSQFSWDAKISALTQEIRGLVQEQRLPA